MDEVREMLESAASAVRSIASIAWQVVCMLPWQFQAGLAAAVLGLITGIAVPTSYNGYVWRGFVITKQQLDCGEDQVKRINRAQSSDDRQIQQKAFNSEYDTFTNCVRGIDVNKSSTRFINEQIKRMD
jgi:hypothetical protein